MLAIVVTWINILAALVAAFTATFYASRFGASPWITTGVFFVSLAIGVGLALLAVAPLHLLIETSLGLAAIEETTRAIADLMITQVKLAARASDEGQRAA